jgi:N-methylhydantoinase B
MVAAPVAQLDPIKYEVFAHRLWAIGEEGRLALQRVTASPIVAQGGECMSSFYAPDGTMILACSGHLRFAAATSDAIKKMVEWFGRSPGIHEGDQLFNNDPYVAGSHTYDQMVVMPIFYEGKLIAWTASSSHTADTGGLLRGGATEVYHEGIRILGLKVVERGEFREDVFKTIIEQCRDPEYVGLDLKSRIAANNVCARRYLELVDRFGPEFVKAAGEKLIRDAEEQARAKLRALPDGTWRSRVYWSMLDPQSREAAVVTVACAMTKQDDELSFDLSGTSPQMANDSNSTLPSTLAHVTIALTNQLFWDVPWSDGRMKPVHVTVPEGTILNCRFPAACGQAPTIGQVLVAALSDCLAKMLYAGGRPDDVNACWRGDWYTGGPGFFYGGHNREGLPTAQGLYDIHGGGLGATPARDGVDTGGQMNIPSGGISDVERIEMQYPFVYFARRHLADGGGFGKYRGGAGSERVFMIYGSADCNVNFKPYAALPQGSFGLFGGHPTGYGGTRAMFETDGGTVLGRLQRGAYPASPDELESGDWGVLSVPRGNPHRLPLPEHSLVADFTQSGGGYGDPLDRPPAAVAHDVRIGITSRRAADLIYGVALDAAGLVDEPGTVARRQAIRDDRRARGRQAATWTPESAPPRSTVSAPDGTVLLRFHEYLEVAVAGGRPVVRCHGCGHVLGPAEENYKQYALEIHQDLEGLSGRRIPSGESYLGEYLLYACPGCATLFQVDTHCPRAGGETPLWDVQLDVARLVTASGQARNATERLS